jgi:hypothetical protein
MTEMYIDQWHCNCPPPGRRDRCWCAACRAWWDLNKQLIRELRLTVPDYCPVTLPPHGSRNCCLDLEGARDRQRIFEIALVKRRASKP